MSSMAASKKWAIVGEGKGLEFNMALHSALASFEKFDHLGQFLQHPRQSDFIGLGIVCDDHETALAAFTVFQQVLNTYIDLAKIGIVMNQNHFPKFNSHLDVHLAKTEELSTLIPALTQFQVKLNENNLKQTLMKEEREKAKTELLKLQTSFRSTLHETLNPLSLVIKSYAERPQVHTQEIIPVLNHIQFLLHKQQSSMTELGNGKKVFSEVNEKSLRDIVVPLIKIFVDQTVATEKELIVDFDHYLLDLILPLPRNLLEQVFFNLIQNAFKFTETGEIKLNARLEKSGLSNLSNILTIEIRNPRPQKVERLENQKGQGLGLGVIESPLRQLGGAISACTDGDHVVLSVKIPFDLAECERLTNKYQMENILPDISVGQTSSLENNLSRVLVWEDSPEYRYWLKENYPQFAVIGNDKEMANVDASKFDLCIVDLSFDHQWLIDQIAQWKKRFPNTLFLTFTAENIGYIKKYFPDDLFDGHLSKPFSIEQLWFYWNKAKNERLIKEAIDLSFLQEMANFAENKKVFISELLNLFVGQSEKIIPQIKQLEKSRDQEALIKILHQLKGTSALVGAKLLNRISTEIYEKLVGADDAREDVVPDLEMLVLEYQKAIGLLKIIENHPNILCA